MWGAIGAIAGSAIGGLFGKSSASSQNKANRQAMRHRWQWEMEDMQKAGLNPMLAINQGGQSVPSMAQAHTPDFASAGLAAGMAYKEGQLLKAQTEAAKATARAATYQADKTREEVGTARSEAQIRANEAGLSSAAAVDLLTRPDAGRIINRAKYDSPFRRPLDEIVSDWTNSAKGLNLLRRRGGGKTFTPPASNSWKNRDKWQDSKRK